MMCRMRKGREETLVRVMKDITLIQILLSAPICFTIGINQRGERGEWIYGEEMDDERMNG